MYFFSRLTANWSHWLCSSVECTRDCFSAGNNWITSLLVRLTHTQCTLHFCRNPNVQEKLTKFSFIVPEKESADCSRERLHRGVTLTTADDTVMKPEFSKTILLNEHRRLQHFFLYLLWWKSSYLIYSSFIAKICLLYALKLTVSLRDSLKRKKMGYAHREKVVPFLATVFQWGCYINTKEWLFSATAYHKNKNCNQSLRLCFPTIQNRIIIQKNSTICNTVWSMALLT